MRISDWSSDVCSSDLRFGWADRPPTPRATLDGDWWVGTGVASATYPANKMPGNTARVRSLGDGRYGVAIGGVDIGTGARTVLTQIAADALDVATADVELELGDRSEEHTSELQSLMRISYAVFCLKKKNTERKQDN